MIMQGSVRYIKFFEWSLSSPGPCILARDLPDHNLSCMAWHARSDADTDDTRQVYVVNRR